jgi:hypothetical protein
MLRLPHFLDNRLTDGGEVISITRRPLSIVLDIFKLYDISEARDNSVVRSIKMKRPYSVVAVKRN